jgi:hypothetical protein
MTRKRITRPSHILKERRKKIFVKSLWVLFALVVFLIALALVSSIDSLVVKKVEVRGNEIVSEEDVSDAAFSVLSQNRFLIFAGENKFLYSKRALEEGIKKAIPRILSLSIVREGDKLLIDITERQRMYLWCGEEAPTRVISGISRDCYFLDKSGFIFDSSPGFSSGVYFTFYSKLNNENPVGQYVLNFDLLKDVESLISGLKDLGLSAHSLVSKDDGQYELLFDLAGRLPEYPKLLFVDDQSVDDIYNKIASILDEDPFKKDFLEKPGKLEYIDARFKNRIFYKFAD